MAVAVCSDLNIVRCAAAALACAVRMYSIFMLADVRWARRQGCRHGTRVTASPEMGLAAMGKTVTINYHKLIVPVQTD